MLDVRAIVETVTLATRKRGGTGNGEEHTLDRLVLQLDGSDQTSTLYRFTSAWWSMGEDGDAGEDVYLFDHEDDARQAFQRQEVLDG